MSDIYTVADAYAARLAAKEGKAATELTRIYAKVAEELRSAITEIHAAIAKRKADGKPVSNTYIEKLDRYQALLVQVNGLLVTAARDSEPIISRQIEDAIYLANRTLLAYSALPKIPSQDAFNTVSATSVKLAAGLFERGPLLDLLEAKAEGSAEVVADTIIQGLVEGWSYDKIAKAMTAAAGGALTNALTIARTEVQRVNRETNLESFRSNTAVEQWIWRANLDTKCCAFCWANAGTIHDLDERMATHPNCRCQVMPYIPSYPFGPPGEDRFAHLPKADQLKILGPSKYRAYKAGKISLPDLIGSKSTADWGRVGYEKSLTAVIGSHLAATFYKP